MNHHTERAEAFADLAAQIDERTILVRALRRDVDRALDDECRVVGRGQAAEMHEACVASDAMRDAVHALTRAREACARARDNHRAAFQAQCAANLAPLETDTQRANREWREAFHADPVCQAVRATQRRIVRRYGNTSDATAAADDAMSRAVQGFYDTHQDTCPS